ncbi:hypothetical protein EJ08DRAFT_694490 [Tothia fuscella]|uniref:Uncharacterized protein n=1 Tax=Tothia fuscella TaxID=1048955 RepID=A0A9P4NYR2_9PEZI|nr:hypothetical protein EJ08DRAFT_694490 [Tothia fuscella]
MSLISPTLTGAKLVGTIIGITLGSVALLFILPFLLFGSLLYFRSVWLMTFKDRAHYHHCEETRILWNAEARREATLLYNAEAILIDWARKNRVVRRGLPVDLSLLNYFPVRRYQRHILMRSFLSIPSQIRFRWFNSGPNANLQITRSEWEEAKARALGKCNIELQTFEQIFWEDDPPPYNTIIIGPQEV